MFSAVLGALVTVSLLWVMQYLIVTGVTAFTEERRSASSISCGSARGAHRDKRRPR
jgi:hypothetical protein